MPSTIDLRDELFFQRLADAQIVVGDPRQAVAGGKTVCTEFDHGESYGQMVGEIQRNAPTLTLMGVRDYIAAAIQAYCPRYATLLLQ